MNAKLIFAMWTAFCVSPEVLVQPVSVLNAAEWTYYCYPPWGGQYASTITAKMRDSSPDWADTEPNPPLSARKAMRLAEATLRATPKKEIKPILERSLVGVRLVPLDGKKWCWEVCYEWHVTVGGSSGPPYDFSVFILMNGTVVRPTRMGDAPWDEDRPKKNGTGGISKKK